jgi:hypothetical protein
MTDSLLTLEKLYSIELTHALDIFHLLMFIKGAPCFGNWLCFWHELISVPGLGTQISCI